jgi:3',5'-cyclic AMP phosphodiesterase CpdA
MPRDLTPRLLAISDLHVAYPENRRLLEELRPQVAGDWLLLAGDVGELFADIEWALTLLSGRFERVIWTPGNHELWTHPQDPVTVRGAQRYQLLVETCRRLGVVTPEDEYPVWPGGGGPLAIAPLFLLYDYSWRPEGMATQAQALAYAYETGVVCTDEMLLHPDPFPSREAWCHERVALTERRLADRDPALPAVFVTHWPLVRQPTDVLWFPQFAQWCGTSLTRDWHVRFNAVTVVYGHLHIPRVTWYDGVRFVEASVGYPREWRGRLPRPGMPSPGVPRQILPVPAGEAGPR